MASLLEQLASGYTAPRVNQSILNQLTAPQTTGELRSYSPPIRQRIIDALVGDNRPSQAKRNFIEGLVGLSDWTPMGAIYGLDEAQRALRAGNTQQAQLNLAGAIPIPAAKGAVKAAQAGIRAYHGSPHDFDRFDITKIGTGEGAQSYGHGLYFAENEAVAKAYRDALSRQNLPADQQTDMAQWAFTAARGDLNAAKQKIIDGIAYYEKKGWPTPNYRAQYDEALAKLNRGEIQTPGKMYEVNINARPEQFLDWDKPIANQPKPIQDFFGFVPRAHADQEAALFRLAQDRGVPVHTLPEYKALELQMDKASAMNRSYPTGANIYESQRLVPGDFRDPQAASQRLNELGIPGIRYLDQGSRGTGQGTHNYVLFNDKLIDILRKYGLAGATATGAVAGATQAPSGDVY